MKIFALAIFVYLMGIVLAGPKWPVVLVRWAAGKEPWGDA